MTLTDIRVSINSSLVIPKDRDQKEIPGHLIRYQGEGFTATDFQKLQQFVAAISATETHHGPAFSLSTFNAIRGQEGKRDSAHVDYVYGIGIDLDKIKQKIVNIDAKGKKKTTSVAKPELYEKYLPTLEQLLATRLGPFISMVYQTPSCPDNAEYVLGRALLFYETPLTPLEHKQFSEWAYQVCQEDLPQCSKDVLDDLGLTGGVDTAMKDTARWWNGIGFGRTPIYTNEDAFLPTSLLKMGMSEGAGAASVKRYLKGQANKEAGIDVGDRAFSDAAYEMFEVIIKDILTESDDNSYQDIFVWIKSFVKLHEDRLADSFADWMEKSPYRLDKSCKGDPYRYLRYADVLSGTHVGTFLRAVERDSPNWAQEYYDLTGKHPVFTNSWELELEELGAPEEQSARGYSSAIKEITMNSIQP